MRILFTRFPLESAHGGAEVQTMALARGLRARGHEVSFLGSCPTLLRLFREDGFDARELRIGPPPVSPRTALTFAVRRVGMERALRSALKRYPHLDAVCMLSLSEKLLLTRTAAKRGARVLWIEHDPVGRWLESNPWKGSLLRASNHARIITVSGLSARLYERLGFPRDRITAIPNGIDLALYAGIPQVAGHMDGPLRLGCVARLAREKGLDVLLDAVALLPGVTLEIAGSGPLEDALRAQARRLGIAEKVTFRTERIDTAAFYARIDALVLPSSAHDPFGLVAAEVMAMAVPVVVSDACGIAEQLTDGTDALVTPAGSVLALRDALALLRSPRERARIGGNGRRTAGERFAVERMVEGYEGVMTSG